jgi:predicted SAM-dependent methyltransferase
MPRVTASATTVLRLHLGCGDRILPGWINIDCVQRPNSACVELDIRQLPYGTGTVAEILAEHVMEHLDFAAESEVWAEIARVLRPGGSFTLEVPDFEWVCRRFLAAQDDWRTFYQVGHPDHYAGCGRDLDQRWGILQTMFFGNQNGAGQYHRSAYTEAKIHVLAAHLGFGSAAVRTLFNKGGQALRATLTR